MLLAQVGLLLLFIIPLDHKAVADAYREKHRRLLVSVQYRRRLSPRASIANWSPRLPNPNSSGCKAPNCEVVSLNLLLELLLCLWFHYSRECSEYSACIPGIVGRGRALLCLLMITLSGVLVWQLSHAKAP